MNQILSTTNKTSKPTNIINIKKIIMFFAIAILVFGIVLAGVKLYNLYIENNKKVEVVNPDVKIEKEGETSVKISVSTSIGINKVVYYWNDLDKNEIQVNGNTSMTKTIDMMAGQNTLTVQVIDKNNNETKYTNQFTSNVDVTKPVINCTADETAKIKITATDETALDYITYKWEDGEETKVTAKTEDPTKIEVNIDAQRGTKKLLITAVDTAKNTSTKEQSFQGVNEPVIDAYQNANIANVKVTHDMGFEKVEFIINR